MNSFTNVIKSASNPKLFHKKTPSSPDDELIPGYKLSKERMVPIWFNASDNYKLKFVLIGKFKRTSPFKSTPPTVFPVLYKCQKITWMDLETFPNLFFLSSSLQ
jgi:hypothetical protein